MAAAASMQCTEDQVSHQSIMDDERDQETQHYLRAIGDNWCLYGKDSQFSSGVQLLVGCPCSSG